MIYRRRPVTAGVTPFKPHMDLAARQSLMEWIDSFSGSFESEIAVPLQMYFAGNDEEHCSLTVNTVGCPSSEHVHQSLKTLLEYSDTHDVLIRFTDYDDATIDDDVWVSSDTAWVVTKASPEQIEDRIGHLQPSTVHEQTIDSSFLNFPEVPSGYKVVAVWWD